MGDMGNKTGIGGKEEVEVAAAEREENVSAALGGGSDELQNDPAAAPEKIPDYFAHEDIIGELQREYKQNAPQAQPVYPTALAVDDSEGMDSSAPVAVAVEDPEEEATLDIKKEVEAASTQLVDYLLSVESALNDAKMNPAMLKLAQQELEIAERELAEAEEQLGTKQILLDQSIESDEEAKSDQTQEQDAEDTQMLEAEVEHKNRTLREAQNKLEAFKRKYPHYEDVQRKISEAKQQLPPELSAVLDEDIPADDLMPVPVGEADSLRAAKYSRAVAVDTLQKECKSFSSAVESGPKVATDIKKGQLVEQYSDALARLYYSDKSYQERQKEESGHDDDEEDDSQGGNEGAATANLFPKRNILADLLGYDIFKDVSAEDAIKWLQERRDEYNYMRHQQVKKQTPDLQQALKDWDGEGNPPAAVRALWRKENGGQELPEALAKAETPEARKAALGFDAQEAKEKEEAKPSGPAGEEAAGQNAKVESEEVPSLKDGTINWNPLNPLETHVKGLLGAFIAAAKLLNLPQAIFQNRAMILLVFGPLLWVALTAEFLARTAFRLATTVIGLVLAVPVVLVLGPLSVFNSRARKLLGDYLELVSEQATYLLQNLRTVMFLALSVPIAGIAAVQYVLSNVATWGLFAPISRISSFQRKAPTIWATLVILLHPKAAAVVTFPKFLTRVVTAIPIFGDLMAALQSASEHVDPDDYAKRDLTYGARFKNGLVRLPGVAQLASIFRAASKADSRMGAITNAALVTLSVPARITGLRWLLAWHARRVERARLHGDRNRRSPLDYAFDTRTVAGKVVAAVVVLGIVAAAGAAIYFAAPVIAGAALTVGIISVSSLLVGFTMNNLSKTMRRNVIEEDDAAVNANHKKLHKTHLFGFIGMVYEWLGTEEARKPTEEGGYGKTFGMSERNASSMAILRYQWNKVMMGATKESKNASTNLKYGKEYTFGEYLSENPIRSTFAAGLLGALVVGVVVAAIAFTAPVSLPAIGIALAAGFAASFLGFGGFAWMASRKSLAKGERDKDSDQILFKATSTDLTYADPELGIGFGLNPDSVLKARGQIAKSIKGDSPDEEQRRSKIADGTISGMVAEKDILHPLSGIDPSDSKQKAAVSELLKNGLIRGIDDNETEAYDPEKGNGYYALTEKGLSYDTEENSSELGDSARGLLGTCKQDYQENADFVACGITEEKLQELAEKDLLSIDDSSGKRIVTVRKPINDELSDEDKVILHALIEQSPANDFFKRVKDYRAANPIKGWTLTILCSLMMSPIVVTLGLSKGFYKVFDNTVGALNRKINKKLGSSNNSSEPEDMEDGVGNKKTVTAEDANAEVAHDETSPEERDELAGSQHDGEAAANEAAGQPGAEPEMDSTMDRTEDGPKKSSWSIIEKLKSIFSGFSLSGISLPWRNRGNQAAPGAQNRLLRESKRRSSVQSLRNLVGREDPQAQATVDANTNERVAQLEAAEQERQRAGSGAIK